MPLLRDIGARGTPLDASVLAGRFATGAQVHARQSHRPLRGWRWLWASWLLAPLRMGLASCCRCPRSSCSVFRLMVACLYGIPGSLQLQSCLRILLQRGGHCKPAAGCRRLARGSHRLEGCSQAALCEEIAVELGFNLDCGRLDVSVHPFTGGDVP